MHVAGLAIFGPPIMLQVPTQTDILQSYASHACNQKNTITYTVMPELGGPEKPLSPHYFTVQLTLFEQGRADYPHLLLLALQCFSPSGITESDILSDTDQHDYEHFQTFYSTDFI